MERARISIDETGFGETEFGETEVAVKPESTKRSIENRRNGIRRNWNGTDIFGWNITRPNGQIGLYESGFCHTSKPRCWLGAVRRDFAIATCAIWDVTVTSCWQLIYELRVHNISFNKWATHACTPEELSYLIYLKVNGIRVNTYAVAWKPYETWNFPISLRNFLIYNLTAFFQDNMWQTRKFQVRRTWIMHMVPASKCDINSCLM